MNINNKKIINDQVWTANETFICENVLSGSQPTGQLLCCQDGKCVAKQQDTDCPPDINRTLVRCQKISDLDCCQVFEKYKNDEHYGKYISNDIKRVCQYQNGIFCLSTPNFSIEGPSKLAHEKQLEWMLSRSKENEYSIGSYACCDEKNCSVNRFVDTEAYLKGKNHPISPSNPPSCLGWTLVSAVYSDSLCKEDSKLAVICPNLFQSGKCRFWGTECENPLLLTYQVTSCNETGGVMAPSNNLSLSDSSIATCPAFHGGLSVGEIIGISTGVGSFLAATAGVVVAYKKYKLKKKEVINSNNAEIREQAAASQENPEAKVEEKEETHSVLDYYLEREQLQEQAQTEIPPK